MTFSDNGQDSPTANDLFLEAVNASMEIEEPADAANVLLQITTALFEAEKVDYASALLSKTLKRIRQLEAPKEKAYLLRLFLTLLCEQGLIDHAAGALPFLDDTEQRAVALKEFSIAQALSGRFDDAMKSAEEIEDLDDYEEILWTIGVTLMKQKRLSEALETASQIESLQKRALLLQDIALLLQEAERPDDANRILDEALCLARSIEDDGERDEAVAAKAPVFARCGRFDDAIALCKEIVDPLLRSSTCHRVADNRELHGNREGIDTITKISVDAAQEINDPFHRAEILCGIGLRMSRHGRSTEAQAVFKETLAVIREIRNLYSRTNALTDFAARLADIGIDESSKKIFRSALASAQEIDDLSLKQLCLCRIIKLQAEAEFLDDAFETLEVVDELCEEIPRNELVSGSFDRSMVGALATLAAAAGVGELLEESVSLFQRGVDTARRIPDPQNRALSLLRLALAFVRFPSTS